LNKDDKDQDQRSLLKSDLEILDQRSKITHRDLRSNDLRSVSTVCHTVKDTMECRQSHYENALNHPPASQCPLPRARFSHRQCCS